MENLQLDDPDMPTFAWYINGSNTDKIAQVVIEFDLLETIHPLHPAFFDYDKGYFITLHYAQNIKRAPEGVGSQLDGDIVTVDMPELGEDLRKYAKQDGTHVTISIPYLEFQGAAKDLTLQFLPGTTFAESLRRSMGSRRIERNNRERDHAKKLTVQSMIFLAKFYRY